MVRLQKLFTLTALLYIALILALVSSLSHVAFAFSTVNGGNDTEAYISAIAIDLGLLALAAGINSRKQQKRSTWTLWAGVILFSIISTYANWLAGIVHVIPLKAEVSEFATWLVSLRPILLSGVLPLLVIYLSEIVSGNYHTVKNDTIIAAPVVNVDTNALVIDESKPAQLPPEPVSNGVLLAANEAKQAKKSERQERVLELINAGLSQSAIAEQLAVSIPTIKRDTKELNGRVK